MKRLIEIAEKHKNFYNSVCSAVSHEANDGTFFVTLKETFTVIDMNTQTKEEVLSWDVDIYLDDQNHIEDFHPRSPRAINSMCYPKGEIFDELRKMIGTKIEIIDSN